MTITIVKILLNMQNESSIDYIYDIYVNGKWAISRKSEENIFSWMRDYTKEHGPAIIEYVES